MKAPEVVRRYVATLLAAAAESDVLEAVRQDMEGLVATLKGSSELAEFLENRLIDVQVKRAALDKIFSGKVQDLTLNFLLLVAERRRAAFLSEIAAAFLVLCAERAGRVTAVVRSATELSDEQAGRLQERLAAYTGKEVELQVQVDTGLKGGLIARIGDTVFDGSLATYMENLRRRLVGAQV
jgi:F-type H+-transporting ATPase subunit delta